jgi:hypothetical protein
MGGVQNNIVAQAKTDVVGQMRTETIGTTKVTNVGQTFYTQVGKMWCLNVDETSETTVGKTKTIDVGEVFEITAGEKFSIKVGETRFQMDKTGVITIEGAITTIIKGGPSTQLTVGPGPVLYTPILTPGTASSPVENQRERKGPKSKTKKNKKGKNKKHKRSGFKTADQAGKAALKEANPQSMKDNREYGGNVYKKSDGTYGYTAPRQGSVNGFQPNPSDVPKDSTLVGDYHTHGNYSDSSGNITTKALDTYDSDHFSPTDITGITKDATGKPEYTGYLGTPSGTFYKLNPSNSSAPQVF